MKRNFTFCKTIYILLFLLEFVGAAQAMDVVGSKAKSTGMDAPQMTDLSLEALASIHVKKIDITRSLERKSAEIQTEISNKTNENLGECLIAISYLDKSGNTIETKNYDIIDVLCNDVLKNRPLRVNSQKTYVILAEQIPDNWSGGLRFQVIKAKTLDPSSSIITKELEEERKAKAESSHDVFKAGFGVGIPYGVGGANLELVTGNYLAFDAGLGSSAMVTGKTDLGWSVGVRTYLLSPRSPFRFRIGTGYGTAGIVKTNLYNVETRTDTLE
ncbi:MAG: hypothetical protein HGB26_08345, partial [Desulfobulbaceae bacterium]|nr:hypothetical protein [Desulfobulbaceae bacterium]